VNQILLQRLLPICDRTYAQTCDRILSDLTPEARGCLVGARFEFFWIDGVAIAQVKYQGNAVILRSRHKLSLNQLCWKIHAITGIERFDIRGADVKCSMRVGIVGRRFQKPED